MTAEPDIVERLRTGGRNSGKRAAMERIVNAALDAGKTVVDQHGVRGASVAKDVTPRASAIRALVPKP